MKKTLIVTALGIMTLVTGTNALAAQRNAAPASDVTWMPRTGSDTLRLHFAGAEIITHESTGGLMIVKAKGQLLHYRPDAYQLIDGEIKPVEVHFRIDGIDQVVVEFGNLDKNAPVILKQGSVMYGQPEPM
jgi:hypothetical protein